MTASAFPLPDDDREYLDANFPDWAPVIEENKWGIIIQNYPIPNGYTPDTTDLMIIIPQDYPMGAIDMFYFSPGIARKDGTAINALSDETHFNQTWQRWSRHYQWQPGVDNIAKHISYVRNQLKSEIPG